MQITLLVWDFFIPVTLSQIVTYSTVIQETMPTSLSLARRLTCMCRWLYRHGLHSAGLSVWTFAVSLHIVLALHFTTHVAAALSSKQWDNVTVCALVFLRVDVYVRERACALACVSACIHAFVRMWVGISVRPDEDIDCVCLTACLSVRLPVCLFMSFSP